MNFRHALLMFVWLLLSLHAFGKGYDPITFPSYQNLSLLAKSWFKNLCEYEFYPTEIMRLAKVAEAEPATVELMKHILADPDGDYEHLVDVITALRGRDDFSAEHQAWLRELLLSKLGRTKGAKESYLKSYGPGLLAKYPSPENEDLMIQYLKDKDVYNAVPEYDVGMSSAGVDGLKVIGTARAISPLREYLKRFPPGANNHEVHEAIAAIEEREKQRASGAASPTIRTKNQAAGNPSLKTSSESSEPLSTDTFSLAAIVVLAAMALGGLTLHQWRKARRK